jgi:hypothetical protein
MRNLAITALLAASLFAAAPAAQAADWSNGEFSCDLEVTALADWWNVFNWGKWDRFTAKLYKNKSPEKAVTFTCLSTIDSKFGCALPNNQIDTAIFDLKLHLSLSPTIKPGTSKSAACEIIFKEAR